MSLAVAATEIANRALAAVHAEPVVTDGGIEISYDKLMAMSLCTKPTAATKAMIREANDAFLARTATARLRLERAVMDQLECAEAKYVAYTVFNHVYASVCSEKKPDKIEIVISRADGNTSATAFDGDIEQAALHVVQLRRVADRKLYNRIDVRTS